MATGEVTIHDLTFDNVVLANLQPNTVVVYDPANSGGGAATPIKLPAAALDEPFGVVCGDKAKLDPTQSGTVVIPNSGVNVRIWGAAFCIAAGAIAAGDRVSIADNTGRVQTQARAAAGVQPAHIVGKALTPASGAGITVMVLLMIGSTY